MYAENLESIKILVLIDAETKNKNNGIKHADKPDIF